MLRGAMWGLNGRRIDREGIRKGDPLFILQINFGMFVAGNYYRIAEGAWLGLLFSFQDVKTKNVTFCSGFF